MSAPAPRPVDLWSIVRDEAAALAAREPMLADFLHANVLTRPGLGASLATLLAGKLAGDVLRGDSLRALIDEAIAADPGIAEAAAADLRALRERDPACKSYVTGLLFFKGYQALQSYRISHWLWGQGREGFAFMLNNRISERFGVDIHPAARIGRGILLDHGTGFVVGETAVIDDHVSLLHEVTLGGTGKESGDRHPKIRRGVLVSAGAKILGNIVVGEGAKVGAGSVVLHDVPAHCTVAGVPARVVGRCQTSDPASQMDHRLDDPG